VTQRTLEAARASYGIVKLQFDTGAGTELDLRLAETVVEQAQANRAALMRSRAQAENGLVLLLGQPQPAAAAADARLEDQGILSDIPAGLPSELLARRPDVLQAEALLRSANADIGAARAAFFPRIALTGGSGTASAALSGLFTAGSSSWSLAPALLAPIFNGGANRANLDVARLGKDIRIARYEKAIQSAFREVADGLAARGTFDDQLASLERYTAAQRRRLELAQLLYQNGAAGYLDVLTAQTDLYNAEQVLVAARLQRLTNLVDLYRALGGGWLARTGDAPRPGDAATPSDGFHP
jgi:multidrug efflux system outer membrane protein